MAQILIPTTCVEDWKSLLAKPDLHWKEGRSAMTLARSWEAARREGFPPEVDATLATSTRAGWDALKLLLAIPEYEVPLPGGSRPSFTDLLAIARTSGGLVMIAVEGKVDEPFGPTLGEKRAEKSSGVNARIDFLLSVLGLPTCPDEIRYQLLHRTASALLVARDFAAQSAVMLVHSFSPGAKWFSDFERFAGLFGCKPEKGMLHSVGERSGISLDIGWCVGDQKFRTGEVPIAE